MRRLRGMKQQTDFLKMMNAHERIMEDSGLHQPRLRTGHAEALQKARIVYIR